MLDEAILKKFQAGLRGPLMQPNDAGYDEARQVYNGMIDRRPRLIVRCLDAADVMAAVNFGRDNNMLVAVRGGGHNAGGLGVCNDGLVIDLSLMKYTRVDPKARHSPGRRWLCTWGEVDHATHAFGMATPTGTIATTGIAGLTLGGGIGHLSRPYGLTIDNLLFRGHGACRRQLRQRQRRGKPRPLLGGAVAAATSASSRHSLSACSR